MYVHACVCVCMCARVRVCVCVREIFIFLSTISSPHPKSFSIKEVGIIKTVVFLSSFLTLSGMSHLIEQADRRACCSCIRDMLEPS